MRLEDLYDDWEKVSRATERTRYTWKRVIRELARHLGHDRASDIKQNDLGAWKDSLLDKGLAVKTIKDGKLAPVRAIFEWSVNNGKLEGNAAARVTVNVRQNPGEKKRGYDDEQANRVLSEATQQNATALRWISWICVISIARASEIGQLRKTDVFVGDGIVCLRIPVEAGSIKTVSFERDIPIHSALLAFGFAHFVKQATDRSLFPDRVGWLDIASSSS